MEQEFSYRNKKLTRGMIKKMVSFHHSMYYTDVTLMPLSVDKDDNTSIKSDCSPLRCHRVVLAAVSPYLHNVFLKEEKKNSGKWVHFCVQLV